ncbi:SpoIIE family protein phosphatase [Actinoplanes sp. NPDC049118]|uniref:SpoIIE family protein phosphatase n=1 Tax=Actinoplanes sp. NPDC049118 TaxID=3155769 RepID=UPI0033FEC335
MPDDGELHIFGEVDAAAEAFEHSPFISLVTDGPELRTVAFNAAARAITGNRLVHDVPILEAFPRELMGQGWPEAHLIPTLTGETVTRDEHRIQLHQPDGSVVEAYVDTYFTPRLGPDGHPRGTIVVTRDVTDRVLKRAALERELDELRERYAAARGSVRAMQRALLADSVPVLPSFDVAARYVLASDEQAAGGDWFDAVTRADGSVVLVVGDVVGHGQTAAVAMGQLRSVLLSQLRAGSGVGEAMRFLDGFAVTVPAARRTTVCIVCVEESGEVRYCTAGHPPPLVLGVDEADTRYLAPTGAGPLATGAEFHTGRARLKVGEAIVLYSDGILERPGTTPAAATLELRTTASNAQHNLIMPAGAPRSAAERICTLTIELLTRISGYSDDITILALQRRPAAAGLDVRLDVTPDAVPRARAALRDWLLELEPGAHDVDALVHATTELVANVVDHAYLGAQPQPFRIRARLERDGTVVLDVIDGGSWKLPVVTAQRGRGLALVRALVDQVEIARLPHGTTASIRHAVRRRAGLLERPAPHAEPDPELFDVWAQDGPQPALTLIGPLDAANVADAAAHLDLALTEAAAVVTVDLSRVTLLASAGVDLLFRATEQARVLGLQVDLIAPNGSPAQHVLTLVGLPYQTASAAG